MIKTCRGTTIYAFLACMFMALFILPLQAESVPEPGIEILCDDTHGLLAPTDEISLVDAMPGDTFERYTKLENQSSKKQKLSLMINDHDKDNDLSKYLNLEIFYRDTVIYKGNFDEGTKEPVSLGTYAQGEKGTLIFNITFSENAGNAASLNTSGIDIAFIAEEVNDASVLTGSNINTAPLSILMVVGGLLSLLFMVEIRKEEGGRQ